MRNQFHDKSVSELCDQWETFVAMREEKEDFGVQYPEFLTMNDRENMLNEALGRLKYIDNINVYGLAS